MGELTQIVPFDMVDEALAKTGATQQRLRMLPAGVWSTCCWPSPCSRSAATRLFGAGPDCRESAADEFIGPLQPGEPEPILCGNSKAVCRRR
ncbi:transposase domain-containing protein [Streptomyces sp. NPDC059717]|uniref:transposase domain-containing protein n=1 Tax=Streptomyces sp. NPDC059717 TaxID=3346922 RepID=UPI0036A582B3